MHISRIVAAENFVFGEDLVALASSLIDMDGIAAVPQAFAILASTPGMAEGDVGEALILKGISLIIGCFAEGSMDAAIDALDDCAPDLAAHARDLLLSVFFPDRAVRHDWLEDAALLCLAALTRASGSPGEARAMIDDACRHRACPDFQAMAVRLRALAVSEASPVQKLSAKKSCMA